MNEFVWETIDDLFKTVYRQSRRVEELEARIADLELRLSERRLEPRSTQSAINDLPAERAA